MKRPSLRPPTPSEPAPLSDGPPPALARLLAAAAFLGAFLLFLVQPLLGKAILPWFGGASAVWSLCLVFYQTGLLAGYAYAHLIARRLPLVTGVVLHSALLLAAAMLVPITPSAVWKPGPGDDPALAILTLLTLCAGAPYALLAATAPLIQSWYAAASGGAAPYRLYAVSNAGSLGALAAYPLLVEPTLGVSWQGWLWSGGFAAFAVVCIAAGWQCVRTRAGGADQSSPPENAAAVAPAARLIDRALWLLAPAATTALLVSATTFITQDVASFPLLWIVPLAIYLLSFILAFDSPRWRLRWVWTATAAVACVLCALVWELSDAFPLGVQLGSHFLLLFSLCMLLHTELFARRPPPQGLTGYYLAISAGGALGGTAIALASPFVLPQRLELPAIVALAWAVQFGVLYTDERSSLYRGGRYWSWGVMLGLYVNFIAVMLLMGPPPDAQVVARARNFYGELIVLDQHPAGEPPAAARRQLRHGRIQHGRQMLEPDLAAAPTSYYVIESAIGRVLTQMERPDGRRLGAVGLGAGTLAAYGRPGDLLTFYEINPQVEELARRHFTYLSESQAEVQVVLGDARLVLEQEVAAGAPRLDVLALDAFSGDAVPAHLLTVEAFRMYFERLAPEGVLAVHISNRYLELARLLRGLAEEFEVEAQYVSYRPDAQDAAEKARAAASVWVLLSETPGVVRSFGVGQPIEFVESSAPPVVWTDDYSNILQLVTFFQMW